MSDFLKIPSLLGFIVLSAIILTLFYSALKKTLPIYNPADVNPELVDSTNTSVNTTIADFHLQSKRKNHHRKITKAKYMLLIFLHNVWFYLSKNDNQSIRCSKAFANNPKVKLLSFTFFQRLIVF
jgi:protein SCO1/2